MIVGILPPFFITNILLVIVYEIYHSPSYILMLFQCSLAMRQFVIVDLPFIDVSILEFYYFISFFPSLCWTAPIDDSLCLNVNYSKLFDDNAVL